MPIALPRLDDRTFADLTGEARAAIPALLPEWTDHNPSDPGIVLVELFAWLTEMLIYQVDQVPDTHVEKFLALLGTPRANGASLDAAIRASALSLRERYRAVTPRDHEELLETAWPAQGGLPLARVRCVPGRDLAQEERTARHAAAPAVVSLLVVPPRSAAGDRPAPNQALIDQLTAFLEPRRLLTTRLRVVGPRYVDVHVGADLVVTDDADPDAVLVAARAAVAAHLDPLTGGSDGTGWPFGRSVWVSEIFSVLAVVPFVEYVESVVLTPADPTRVLTDDGGVPTGVAIDGDELVTAVADGLLLWYSDGTQPIPRPADPSSVPAAPAVAPTPAAAPTDPTALVVPAALAVPAAGMVAAQPPAVPPAATAVVPAVVSAAVPAAVSAPPLVPAVSGYLAHLPRAHAADPFLGEFLLGFEQVLSGLPGHEGLQQGIEEVVKLLDPDEAPPEFLPWLASWVGLTLRADWPEATRRTFIRKIVPLYRLRGTPGGLQQLLALYTEQKVEIHDVDLAPPFFFTVELTLAVADPAAVRRIQQIARTIVDQERPAHTYYALQITTPTMRLVSPELQAKDAEDFGVAPPRLVLGHNTLLGSARPHSAGSSGSSGS